MNIKFILSTYLVLLCLYANAISITVLNGQTVNWTNSSLTYTNITIENGGVLSVINCNLNMDNGSSSKILVKNGGQLKVNNSVIKSATTAKWMGIVLEGGSYTGLAADIQLSKINDAFHAVDFTNPNSSQRLARGFFRETVFEGNDANVKATGGGQVTLSNATEFNRCDFFGHNGSGKLHISNVKDWTFRNYCRFHGNISYSPQISTQGSAFVKIMDSDIVTIEGSEFFYFLNASAISVKGISSNIKILNNVMSTSDFYVPNLPYADYNFALIELGEDTHFNTSDLSYLRNIYIKYNEFGFGPWANESVAGIISRHIEGINNLKILSNSFYGLGVGVDLEGVNGGLSLIRENVFFKCATGVISNGNNAELRIVCNRFDGNGDLGIGIMINDPVLYDHSVFSGNKGAGNKFTGLSWGDIWNNTATTFKYAFDANGPLEEPGVIYGIYGSYQLFPKSLGYCEGDPTYIIANPEPIDVKVSPNPSSTYINVFSIEGVINFVTIYNMLGVKQLESSDKRIDISSLSPGTYLVHATSAQGKGMTKLIIE